MSTQAESEPATPVSVSLRELIALKAAGERIKLSTPRISAVTAGGHLSPFKGRGVEFDESRPYQEGDDLRTMDWRVTARSGKPHTKVFREERNRPVLIWLDAGASMMFATRGAYKSVVAARMAALIAWSAIAHGDQLGGLVFNAIRTPATAATAASNHTTHGPTDRRPAAWFTGSGVALDMSAT